MDIEDIKKELREYYGDLKQQRDQLRVRVHLAGTEVRDEWKELEKKWQQFESRSALVFDEAKDAGEDVAEAAKLLGSELKDAFRRIGRRLQ